MNNVLFEAKDGFDHGPYSFKRPGDTAVMPEHTANSLRDAGLGTIKAKPKMANKMLPDSLGNADGKGVASPSLPVGQASQTPTSNASGSGNKLTLRGTK